MPVINERTTFIEETGIFFESLGLTRMAGRILGFLMVTDKERVSFDELTQVLHASKSSISTNIKTLVTVKFIKPITTPGDRKTYYTLSHDISWSEIFNKRVHELNHLTSLFNKALNLRTNRNDSPGQWLSKAMEFYEWLESELPQLMEKWEKYQQQKSA